MTVQKYIANFIVVVLFTFNKIVTSEDKTSILALFSLTSCNSSRFDFNCEIARKNVQRMTKYIITDVSLCIVDIKDERMLLHILLKFYDAHINFNGLCKNKNISENTNVNKTFVFTYMTFELTQVTSAMLLTMNVPLVSITFRPMYPAQFVENRYFIYSNEAGYTADVHKTAFNIIRKKFNITYIGFLNLYNGTDIVDYGTECKQNDKRAFCFYTQENLQNICMKERGVNVFNIREINASLHYILQDPRLTVLILYGKNSLIKRFYTEIHKFKFLTKTLFFLEFEKEETKIPDNTRLDKRTTHGHEYPQIIINIPGSEAINELLSYIQNFRQHFIHNERFIIGAQQSNNSQKHFRAMIKKNLYLITFFVKDFKENDTVTGEVWRQIPDYVRGAVFDQLGFKHEVLAALILYFKKINYRDLTIIENIFYHQDHSLHKALEAKPRCELTKPICGLGTELRYSYYMEENWKNSLGYRCKLCKKGYYKNTTGDRSCKHCGKHFESNLKRTFCFDPYESIYLSVKNSFTTKVVMALSLIQITLILFTLAIFLIYRSTPVVLHSNKNMSILQLFVQAILAIASLALFIGIPNIITCTLRPIIIGITLTITMAINLGKTQKLIQIFQSKTKISGKELVLTKVTEWIMIIITLASDISILIISIQESKPTQQITYYPATFQKEIHCNNNKDILIQFAFVFVLVFCNGVQGIKARKLPSHFRETLHLTYSAFMSSILLIVSVAIFFSQESQHAKTVTVLFTTMLMNFLHYMLLYAYKVYIILCKSELNTKRVFDEKRIQKIEKRYNNKAKYVTNQTTTI